MLATRVRVRTHALEGPGAKSAKVDWIVCHGHDQPVKRGRVKCPLQGTTRQSADVDVEECLACRHLQASSVDRLPAGVCSASGAHYSPRW
jgi:hypothetical protein